MMNMITRRVINGVFFCLSYCVFLSSFSLAIDHWSGDSYWDYSETQHSDACHLIKELPVNNVKRIMDLGCGPGGNIEALLAHFSEATLLGVDPDCSMLATAKEKFSDNSRTSFLSGRAEDFKVDEKFDLIFAIHVMHWVPAEEQLQALKNIYRHLESHGKFAVILAPPKDGLPFQWVLNRLVQSEPYVSHLKGFKQTQTVYWVDEYRKLLEAAGFSIEYIGYYYGEHRHRDSDALKFWLQQWLPEGKYLYKQSPDLHKCFMRDLVSHFAEETQQDPDETMVWGEYMLKAVAVKK